MRRARILLLLSALGVSVLLASSLAIHELMPEPAPPAWANDYDVSAQTPEAIASGTVVDRSAPAGWSHLVIKSLPRVKPSEVQHLPAIAVSREDMARRVAWMFTVFTADVVPEQQGSQIRYRLRAIGLGLGANVNGRDTVLTAETAEQLGVNLDIFQKLTLITGYKVQKESKIVIHGPSFALVDTPVTYRCGEKNRMIRFRYALLVNSATGQLGVFTWRLGSAGDSCSDLARAVLLNPNTIDEAELIPDLTEFNKLGIPNDLTFGVDELPPHRLERTIPVELRDLVGQTRFTADEAHSLEDGLRKLLPAQ